MIRPPVLARAWPRDLLWFLLLAARAAVLLPLLHASWPDLFGAEQDDLRRSRAWADLLVGATQQMASIYLLMALGFLLCLRCGAIDASVWVVSSLGGVLAAHAITVHHLPPWLAMALGVLGGAIVGTINGLLTAVARLPSIVATLLTALMILLALQLTQNQRQIRVPDETFDRWHLPAPARASEGVRGPDGPSPGGAPLTAPDSQPLYVTRMLLVLGAYSLVLLALMAGDWRRPRSWGPGSRKTLWASMIASGALSAGGGVLWILDRGVAPVATRLVDNLTVPVAAVLAGGAFLAGRGRTLLAAVFLPAALLLTNTWEGKVDLRQLAGYRLQTLLLGCMLLLVHLAGNDFTAGRRARTLGPLLSCLLAVCAIVLVAAGAGASSRVDRWVQLGGLIVWLLAAALLLVTRMMDKDKSLRDLFQPPPAPPPDKAG